MPQICLVTYRYQEHRWGVKPVESVPWFEGLEIILWVKQLAID